MAERNRDNEETNDPVTPSTATPSTATPSTATPSTADSDSATFTVGIGASAGGLEALQEFFQHMPADSGMAFVVVAHQHPEQTSLLPELLSKRTKMPVTPATDGQRLKPNHVYIGTSKGCLSLMNGRLVRMDPERTSSPKLPIDHFFRSLAEDQRERAICIILSGTGTDGTLGLKAVKGESGIAMVERPSSAKFAGMPSSAIATGISDYVLTPAEMPDQLIAYAQSPSARVAPFEEPSVPAEPMRKVFLLLRNHTGHDFSAYKTNTVCRCVRRRMSVQQIQGPHQYVRFLQENPHEIDVLFKELLVSVTSFFRDPEAWRALATPLERLVQSKAEGETIRVWVPGCASGEEVYSLAMLLRESMQKLNRDLSVQVIGTDLNIKAIEVARFGEYPSGIAGDVDDQRLKKFFVHADDHYRIRKEIREMSIFAPQNVIRDPPFTKQDIICCRNLLIYLNSDLQKKLIPIFHYALQPEGLLFLGPSETIGTVTKLFEVIDKRAKIFRRREVPAATASLPEIPAQAVFGRRGSGATRPLVEPESLRGLLRVTLRPGGQSVSPQVDTTGDKPQHPDEDQRTAQLVAEQVVGKLLAEIGGGDWNIPELIQRIESIFLQNWAMENRELRWNFSTVGPRTLRISARRLKREKGLPAMLLMAIEVVTASMQDNDAGQGIVNS